MKKPKRKNPLAAEKEMAFAAQVSLSDLHSSRPARWGKTRRAAASAPAALIRIKMPAAVV
jgi:hypothetical protein